MYLEILRNQIIRPLRSDLKSPPMHWGTELRTQTCQVPLVAFPVLAAHCAHKDASQQVPIAALELKACCSTTSSHRARFIMWLLKVSNTPLRKQIPSKQQRNTHLQTKPPSATPRMCYNMATLRANVLHNERPFLARRLMFAWLSRHEGVVRAYCNHRVNSLPGLLRRNGNRTSVHPAATLALSGLPGASQTAPNGSWCIVQELKGLGLGIPYDRSPSFSRLSSSHLRRLIESFLCKPLGTSFSAHVSLCTGLDDRTASLAKRPWQAALGEAVGTSCSTLNFTAAWLQHRSGERSLHVVWDENGWDSYTATRRSAISPMVELSKASQCTVDRQSPSKAFAQHVCLC